MISGLLKADRERRKNHRETGKFKNAHRMLPAVKLAHGFPVLTLHCQLTSEGTRLSLEELTLGWLVNQVVYVSFCSEDRSY